MTDRELLETMFIEQRLMALKIKRMSEELSEVQSVTTRIEENQEFMEIELKSIRAQIETVRKRKYIRYIKKRTVISYTLTYDTAVL